VEFLCLFDKYNGVRIEIQLAPRLQFSVDSPNAVSGCFLFLRGPIWDYFQQGARGCLGGVSARIYIRL